MFVITLPVYYTFEATRNKKPKKVLVSSNWYRNAHHFNKAKVKKHYDELIQLKLRAMCIEPIKGKWKTKYVYYYKNKGSDGSNVCSMMEKFSLDAFQTAGIVEEDNVLFHSSDGFDCEYDKDNPRIEIKVYKNE